MFKKKKLFLILKLMKYRLFIELPVKVCLKEGGKKMLDSARKFSIIGSMGPVAKFACMAPFGIVINMSENSVLKLV